MIDNNAAKGRTMTGEEMQRQSQLGLDMMRQNEDAERERLEARLEVENEIYRARIKALRINRSRRSNSNRIV